MKQVVKEFAYWHLSNDSSERLDDQINKFLKKHDEYKISRIEYCPVPSGARQRILVVFDIEE